MQYNENKYILLKIKTNLFCFLNCLKKSDSISHMTFTSTAPSLCAAMVYAHMGHQHSEWTEIHNFSLHKKNTSAVTTSFQVNNIGTFFSTDKAPLCSYFNASLLRFFSSFVHLSTGLGQQGHWVLTKRARTQIESSAVTLYLSAWQFKSRRFNSDVQLSLLPFDESQHTK